VVGTGFLSSTNLWKAVWVGDRTFNLMLARQTL